MKHITILNVSDNNLQSIHLHHHNITPYKAVTSKNRFHCNLRTPNLHYSHENRNSYRYIYYKYYNYHFGVERYFRSCKQNWYLYVARRRSRSQFISREKIPDFIGREWPGKCISDLYSVYVLKVYFRCLQLILV